MILERTHQRLGWPSPEEILNPAGSGPKVYARLADEKLGRSLRRLLGRGAGVHIGILAPDPRADATEAPIALVCEFNNPVGQKTLVEAHRLAWSFCRAPLLITLEPHMVRSWSCCEPPAQGDLLAQVPAEIAEIAVDLKDDPNLVKQAAQSLRWVELASGQFYRRYEKRFQRSRCADYLLLENLKEVRNRLKAQRLDYDTIHDLLARLIFIQFLFDRKDGTGKAALGPPELDRLEAQGVLSRSYSDLQGVLQDYADTYRLFRRLNEVFNGDLFPGKGATEDEREAEWQGELKKVKRAHLDTLSEFVSGRMRMKDGQLSLWREYSFDTIPLEFISSIYEEFVGKTGGATGAHYTPGHIVDFVLDKVLPWNSDEWNLKVLDPACGSGIFLVKAYQRLIHRWRNAHPDEEPKAQVLKQLLTRNLFGVDKDPHAVRVASFSLYLAMCDEMDPRYYWTQVKFPRLRDRRLVAADFFLEDKQGFRTDEDQSHYDIVVGNAPWGKDTETTNAKQWKTKHRWTTTYGSVGPLFLPKAARLTRLGGRVAMLQPAGLIFHDVGPSRTFRAKLFSEFKVEEVVNLSALRFGLFKGAVSPACFISMRATECDGEPLVYVSPKPTLTNEDDYRVIIEPHDIHFIQPDEAAHERHMWTTLMWGGQRDLQLVRKLGQFATLEQAERNRKVSTRKGRFRGDKKRRQDDLLGMPLLEDDRPLNKVLLFLDARTLPKNTDPYTHSRDSTGMSAFRLPQMILKHSWRTATGRLKAVVVRSDASTGAVFCNRNFTSVHAEDPHVLEAACLIMNSSAAVYYLLLTSGRLASYRPEPNKSDLLRMPLPKPVAGLLRGVRNLRDLDARSYQALELNKTEAVLVEDLNNVTLKDFKGDHESPGRRQTKRGAEPDLKAYVRSFVGVLKAGFGVDKKICATVFQETSEPHVPIRLVAIHLGWADTDKFRLELMPQGQLTSRLHDLNEKFLETPEGAGGGIFYQRVARVYDTVNYRGVNVPTVYLIKPDQLRYWTRSMGMRDADEVAADIMSWQEGSDPQPSVQVENRIA
ncbi:MAG: N-6 DNA methylase [Phycisphaerales bacterium]|nr:MAG: N-6 DNA methylase [Phycisphaerales bacterium]